MVEFELTLACHEARDPVQSYLYDFDNCNSAALTEEAMHATSISYFSTYWFCWGCVGSVYSAYLCCHRPVCYTKKLPPIRASYPHLKHKLIPSIFGALSAKKAAPWRKFRSCRTDETILFSIIFRCADRHSFGYTVSTFHVNKLYID